MAMREVYSSTVERIGHEDGVLRVEWKSGKVSLYHDVPEKLANEVMNAPSIGSALRSLIQPGYRHAYE